MKSQNRWVVKGWVRGRRHAPRKVDVEEIDIERCLHYPSHE